MKKKIGFVVKEVDVKTGAMKQEVKMDESIAIHMVKRRLGEGQLIDNEKVEWLIKGTSINADNIKKALVIEGKKYYFYLSTPAQMKKSEGFFVREDIIPTFKFLENIVSTGKLDRLVGEDICVNKDIIARVALLFSGVFATSIIPNIVILPDTTYKVIEDVKILEDGKLVERNDFEMEVTPFDGCAIASLDMFKRIAKDLQMDYTPSWVTVRCAKFAMKGLLTSVSIIDYFNDFYTADTEFIKKIKEEFYLKDCYGEWIKVDNNTIIANESFCKWHKFYNSTSEFKLLDGYEDLMQGLFVVKTGKKQAKKYVETSYQSLCALALTNEDVVKLGENTFDFYKRVLGKEQGAVLEFLKIIGKEEEGVTKADKLATLLSCDYDHFIKTSYVKRELAGVLKRKIKELASGTMTVKGNFKVMVSNPIAFLDYAMNRTLNSDLTAGEFYVANESGNRTFVRYPVASPFEISNNQLVDSALCDKYLNFTNDMIVFNVEDDKAGTLSGADFDGDLVCCYDNEIITNAVVPYERRFVNTADGASAKVKYDWASRVDANVAILGNLIGGIALTASSIGNVCQETKFLYNGEVKTTREMRVETEDNWELLRETEIKGEEAKKLIIEEFYKRETDISKCVQMSMIEIDAPKTLVSVSIADKEELKAMVEKKPYFFSKLPDKVYGYNVIDIFDGSSISRYCKLIENTLKKWEEVGALPAQIYSAENDFSLLFDADVDFNEDKAQQIYNQIKLIYNDKLSKQMDLRNDRANLTTLEYIEKYRFIQSSTEMSMFSIVEEKDMNDLVYASYKLIRDNTKYSDIFLVEYLWDVVETLLVNKYDTIQQLVANENGELKGKFETYTLKTFKNNIETGAITKKAKERISKKFKEGTKISIRIDEDFVPFSIGVITKKDGVSFLNGLEIFENSLSKINLIINENDILNIASMDVKVKSAYVYISSIN